MPWASSRRPLLGLGVLAGKLKSLQYQVTTCYPNISFAKKFGYENYEYFADNPVLYPFAEYLFAAIYFQYDQQKIEESLKNLISKEFFEVNAGFFESVSHLIGEMIPQFVYECKEEVLKTDPQIVGFSSTFNQIFPSLLLCKEIKQERPEMITLLGGSCFHGEMGVEYSRCFCDMVDYVFVGEADNSLPAFLGYLNGEKEYREIDGIASRGIILKDTVPVANMRDVSAPVYDEYFTSLHLEFQEKAPQINEGLPFESSRGCWWGQKNHCTFCGLNNLGMTFRFKEDEIILAELKALSEKYKSVNFISADNILRSNAYQSLLPVLAILPVKYNLFYEIKANLKRKDVFALYESGVSWIQPGIESFSSNILKCMKKGISGIQNVQLLRLAKEYNIHTSYNVLTGFLGEKKEDYLEMIKVIEKILHLQPPSGNSTTAQVHRFSPMHNTPEEFGLKHVRPCSYYYDWFPKDFIDYEKAAYFFEADPNFERAVTTDLNLAIQQWLHSKETAFAEVGFNFITITRGNQENIKKETLSELESLLILLADEVVSQFTIFRYLDEIVSATEIEKALQVLEQKGYLLSEDGKYLNLIPYNRIIPPHTIPLWISQMTEALKVAISSPVIPDHENMLQL